MHEGTPVAGVHIHEIMAEIGRQYDLNVEERERVEWLLGTGLLPTIGNVADTFRFPQRPSSTTNT